MTAEIAIINRSAIALAADSAVTIGRERVWKSTNKLFSLSPLNDVGIMIYGSGDFCGVPWDVIIKTYRFKTEIQFDTVDKLKDDFIEFLRNFPNPQNELKFLNTYILLADIVSDCLEDTQKLAPMIFRAKAKENIRRIRSSFDQFELLPKQVSVPNFDKEYAQLIDEFIKEKTDHKVTKGLRSQIIGVCRDVFNRNVGSGYETGLVFAGFGENQIFAEIIHIVCDGQSNWDVRFWSRGKRRDLNDEECPTALIMPFGQRDIFHLFVEGIDESYLYFLHDFFGSVLKERSNQVIERYVPKNEQLVEAAIQQKENDAAMKAFMNEFADLRFQQAISPMMTVVQSLPKEEMAAMAEALVEITSLRRKVDSKLESVGGPVDVAVISKGDGFVWIKRKHYFDVDLNSDFAVRRRMRHAWGKERSDG